MSNPLNINQGLDTGSSTRRDIDGECYFPIKVEGSDDAKRELQPELALSLGCRVMKHPDCCVLCAANNDCDLIPLHWNCRCRPEGYLEIEDVLVT